MGNRAVIQTQDGTGIYLHWNGGPESVLAFLDAAKHFNVRTGDDYGVARLVQIIGNFFGGTLSLGVGRASQMDRNNGDNGTYIIDAEFKIIDRKFNGCDKAKSVADLDQSRLSHYKDVFDKCVKVNDPIFSPKKE